MQFYYGGMKLHEFSGAYPEDVIQKKIDHFAVSGSAQKIDENGNPVYQGIDQSKLVPLLVKTIQEQQTVIEALETRITALEAG